MDLDLTIPGAAARALVKSGKPYPPENVSYPTCTASIPLRRLALGLIAALPMAIPTEASFVGPVDLGTAGPDNWTILALGGTTANSRTDVTIDNESMVNGNVGVADAGSISMSGNGTITGTLYLNTAGSLNNTGTGGPSAIVQDAAGDTKLNQAVKDAFAASFFAAQLVATNPLTAITSSMVINGNAGANILNLSTLDLKNNDVLALTAPAGGSFIINVSGDFNINGGQIVLGGDLTPVEVLYNVTGTGNDIAFLGVFGGGDPKAILSGILLTPFRSIGMSKDLVCGEIIGGGDNITLTGGSDVVCLVPEVSTALPTAGVLLLAICVPSLRRRFKAH
jgi:hypothetical protein